MEHKFSAEIQTLIDAFAVFDNWEDKYAYLIDLGKQLEPLEEACKVEKYLVSGCTSKVWLMCRAHSEKYFFRADSDAHIVRGLVAILLKVYSGRTKMEIEQIDIEALFATLGLGKHLSPNRSSGFFAVHRAILALSKK